MAVSAKLWIASEKRTLDPEIKKPASFISEIKKFPTKAINTGTDPAILFLFEVNN